MTITIYSKPACVQCNATYRALDRQGIAYQVVDIEQDAKARQNRGIPGLSPGTGGGGR